MDLLLVHRQEKRDNRSTGLSTCDLKLFTDNNNIEYVATFDFEYQRFGEKKCVTHIHKLNLNIETGNFSVTYFIDIQTTPNNNNNKNEHKTITKKNVFGMLNDLVENGIYRGEKRHKYWGIKYDRVTDKLFDLIYNKLEVNFTNQYIKEKNYKNKYTVNPLYDLLVDYFLDVRNIKSHDGVYHDIKFDFPKTKYLKQNDYKFLPAVLESYSIKSKYLIGELNKLSDNSVNIRSLNYLCKLFGSNYIDYLKKIDWKMFCHDQPINKKIHELKNVSEKKSLVGLINNWERKTLRSDSLLYNLNKILTIREHLETKGLNLKFNAKNDIEFENLLETWSGIKEYLSRGYKIKYVFPDDFIKEIEEPIIVDDDIFLPKILTTEEDFRVEAYIMKNCLSRQFSYGSFYIYISLKNVNKRKRINVQYRKGSINQQYGKANSDVPELFKTPVEILTKRIRKYPNIEWDRLKYDFITTENE